jgi:Ethanolamine utilization protein EutJ (predicted chaperonin)
LGLNGAYGITTFKSGTNTYAAVTSTVDDSVQILNVTDPDNVTATDQITDGGNLELNGGRDIATFKSGTNTYVAVASYTDDGVQILDVTDPDSITPTSQITDGGNLELDGPRGITTFKSGSHTYVAVASYYDD